MDVKEMWFKNLFFCKDNDDDDICPEHILNKESVITPKIYGMCKRKELLDADKIGPAKATENIRIGDKVFIKGKAVSPPEGTADIEIEDLIIKKITVTRKTPNKFKKGFWNVDIKYIFGSRIIFRNKNDHIIGSVKAESVFIQESTLYGSICPKYVIGTDMLSIKRGAGAGPFVLVKAKAVILEKHPLLKNASQPKNVTVVIGLLTEISLFRIANLIIDSEGFCDVKDYDAELGMGADDINHRHVNV